MNTALHGTNGLNPKVSYIIYKAYVLPRMLYRLEVIHMYKTQLQQLEKYHLRTLRQLQTLAQRTATSAVFMLLGALPTEAEIHEKQLSLLHSVITSDINVSKVWYNASMHAALTTHTVSSTCMGNCCSPGCRL